MDLPENVARILCAGRYVGSDTCHYGLDLNRDPIVLDEPVDVMISFETIEHLNDPLGFLKQLYRATRDGGLLVLSTPLNPGERPVVFKSDHVQEFSYRQMAALLQKAGFQPQEAYSMGLGFGSAIRFLRRFKVNVYRPDFGQRRTRLSRWADRMPGLTWLYCRIGPFGFLGNTGTNMLRVARTAAPGEGA